MTKRKKKPYTPPAMPTQWDSGADGKANRVGLIFEPVGDFDPDKGEVINPNGVRRARRVDMLEIWHRKGTITTAGFNAAEKLRDAYEGTQRSPGWQDSERVQSSPKPDHAVTIQIDRMSDFVRVSRLIADGDRAIIEACVLDRGSPRRIRAYRNEGYAAGLVHLREALDRLAKAMGA